MNWFFTGISWARWNGDSTTTFTTTWLKSFQMSFMWMSQLTQPLSNTSPCSSISAHTQSRSFSMRMFLLSDNKCSKYSLNLNIYRHIGLLINKQWDKCSIQRLSMHSIALFIKSNLVRIIILVSIAFFRYRLVMISAKVRNLQKSYHPLGIV